jgi:hypothetical protein
VAGLLIERGALLEAKRQGRKAAIGMDAARVHAAIAEALIKAGAGLGSFRWWFPVMTHLALPNLPSN